MIDICRFDGIMKTALLLGCFNNQIKSLVNNALGIPYRSIETQFNPGQVAHNRWKFEERIEWISTNSNEISCSYTIPKMTIKMNHKISITSSILCSMAFIGLTLVMWCWTKLLIITNAIGMQAKPNNVYTEIMHNHRIKLGSM